MTGWAAINQVAAGPAAIHANAWHDPAGFQARWLCELLQRNAATSYGRRHGFVQIRTIDDYRRQVPIILYEDLADDIALIAAGATDVLTSDPVIAFEETSGSTAGRKLIPYTRAGLRDFEAAALVWLRQQMARHPAIAAGKCYWSISPAGRPPRHTSGGVPIGFASDAGYFSVETGAALASLSVTPFALGMNDDVPEWRFQTLLSLLAGTDLTFISIWSPTFLSSLLDALPDLADRLLGALHDGLPALRFPAHPQRASEVAAAFKHDDLTRIWPRLALISAWSHGAAAMPFMALKRRFPGVAFDGKGLMATEGVISISGAGRRDPVPALASTLVEFIDDGGRSHLAHELTEGQTYRIVITTRSGLYRYDLGDLVACSRLAGGMPELVFLGRDGLVSDMVGEKLSEPFVAAGLAQLDLDAILAPQNGGAPHYLLLSHTPPSPTTLARLEAFLCGNPHYAYARRIGQLHPIAWRPCLDPHGTYQHFRNRQGQILGGIKPPALFATIEDAAGFLAALNDDGNLTAPPEATARRIA